MGTIVRPAKTSSPGPWDACADVEVIVDGVPKELAPHGEGRHPAAAIAARPPLTVRCKAVMAI
jgi:hypothetical protein